MKGFGKRLRECREAKGLSQQELAKLLKTSHSVVGRYERDEMIPSIEVAANMAKLVDTTLAYLVGEAGNNDLLKDQGMLKRLHDINALSDQDKTHILYALDGLLRDAKTRKAYA